MREWPYAAAVDTQPRRFHALAELLAVLASPVRLELLHALRTPRELNEIRIFAPDGGGDALVRPLARQTVTHHLDTLLDAGLVRRLADEGKARGALYVLNHPRVFAAVDEMRHLARLRPGIVDGSDGGATIDAASHDAGPQLPPCPRLMVAYGRENGVSYALPTAPGARATIGRAPPADVVLDYDPYLSSVHAAVERATEGHALQDMGSRNGTWLNWVRIAPDAPVHLTPGDLITVGRTVLVYQA